MCILTCQQNEIVETQKKQSTINWLRFNGEKLINNNCLLCKCFIVHVRCIFSPIYKSLNAYSNFEGTSNFLYYARNAQDK